MKIAKATRGYETWLAKHLTIVQADLKRKHEAMSQDVFFFLRATFYRWMQLWPKVCPDDARAPRVLAVGDLHVENFGTWRDVEGRLVWGINDFDEAYELPYTIDLVRLAASAHIAIRQSRLKIAAKDACVAILDGYREGLKTGGVPYVLARRTCLVARHGHWRPARSRAIWTKLDGLTTWRGPVPKGAVRAIERRLPEPGLQYRLVHRMAGLGSLGRQRFVAIANYRGATIAREAKALAPSACVWAAGGKASQRIEYQVILDRAVRAVDPSCAWGQLDRAASCARLFARGTFFHAQGAR